MPEIVLQTNGSKYAGPLLQDRYQVMERHIGGGYYVLDHTKPDVVPTQRFASIEDAERSVFTNTPGSVYVPSTLNEHKEPGPVSDTTEEAVAVPKKSRVVKATKAAKAAPKAKIVKAKPPTRKTAAPKPKAEAKVVKATKPARKPKTEVRAGQATAKPVPKAKPRAQKPKVEAPAAPAPVSAPETTTKTRPGTVRKLYEDLILEHKLTDKEIVAAVHEAFPVRNHTTWASRERKPATKHQSVAWYRAAMRRAGYTVPEKVT
jgi:outer membrane biosynthesis protein TonB